MHGEFTCKNCHTTFEKATPTHGAGGYCCQCEIALGILLIHDTPEENHIEQIRTRAAINGYVRAFHPEKFK